MHCFSYYMLACGTGTLLLWNWSWQSLGSGHCQCSLQSMPLCWHSNQWYQWRSYAWSGRITWCVHTRSVLAVCIDLSSERLRLVLSSLWCMRTFREKWRELRIGLRVQDSMHVCVCERECLCNGTTSFVALLLYILKIHWSCISLCNSGSSK
jgi:hypothetical protein